jgi:hypothetical protein
MNTNPWLEQRMNEEHQRQLREVAERERLAQLCRSEQPARPRKLLSKLRAEMNELATRWQKTKTVPTRELQRQS